MTLQTGSGLLQGSEDAHLQKASGSRQVGRKSHFSVFTAGLHGYASPLTPPHLGLHVAALLPQIKPLPFLKVWFGFTNKRELNFPPFFAPSLTLEQDPLKSLKD